MRLNIYYFIGAVFLLCSSLSAGTALGQEEENCPAIEVNCADRKAGDFIPLRCTASVESFKKAKITYEWSLSWQAPMRITQGHPDEIEVDLSSNPNQKLMVVLTVRGLPQECENRTQSESLPEKVEAPAEDDEEEMDSTLEERKPEVQPINNIAATGSCYEEVTEGAMAFFSVNVGDAVQGVNLNYSWTLSRGRLKSGQGTRSILVDTTGLGGEIITATTRIDGLASPLRLSCTTMIKRIPRAYKLDEFSSRSLDDEEEASRLRRFALRLNIGLDERAYIVVTGRRGQALGMLQRRAERVRDYLIEEFKVAPARIMGTGVGLGKDETIQLWVIQNGASPP
jgi:hypothetical protein